MKKTLLLGLLIIGMSCYSQGTTQKEYNYASKGYADDLAMGKDIISGYKLERVLTPKQAKTNEVKGSKSEEVSRYSFLYKLVRIDSGQIAVFLLEEKRPGTNFDRYYALPNNLADSSIWNQAQGVYAKNLETNKCDNAGASFGYSWNVLRFLSEALSN